MSVYSDSSHYQGLQTSQSRSYRVTRRRRYPRTYIPYGLSASSRTSHSPCVTAGPFPWRSGTRVPLVTDGEVHYVSKDVSIPVCHWGSLAVVVRDSWSPVSRMGEVRHVRGSPDFFHHFLWVRRTWVDRKVLVDRPLSSSLGKNDDKNSKVT